MSAQAWRPVAPYMHAGVKLHPKLSYLLPDGMGPALAALGLFAAEEGDADMDLSALPWDANTNKGGTVTPNLGAHGHEVQA